MRKPTLDRGLLLTPFPLYSIVLVDRGDFRHYGQILSRPTPTDTYMVRMVPGHPGTLKEMPLARLQPPQAGIKIRWVHYAMIDGRGSFPVDMLRYDYAAPVNFELIEDDDRLQVKIDPTFGSKDMIIARASHERLPRWTDARWNSFLWGVRTMHTEELKHENA